MLSRFSRMPLGAHAAALLIVLLALMPYVRTDAVYYSDEGQAVIQAQHLANGDGSIVPDPVAAADPAATDYPLTNADVGAKGIAPLAKHPTYPLVLAVLDRIGGTSAMIGTSVSERWAPRCWRRCSRDGSDRGWPRPRCGRRAWPARSSSTAT